LIRGRAANITARRTIRCPTTHTRGPLGRSQSIASVEITRAMSRPGEVWF
jgi:hypothetical protein